MNTNNPIADLVRSIVREELESMLGASGMVTADDASQPEPEPAPRASWARPASAQPVARRAPVRTATPAHYRPTKYATTRAGQEIIASLTPRLRGTFAAIARRKSGLSRPDVSSATGTTPKQAENNVYGLQTRQLIETFYPDAK